MAANEIYDNLKNLQEILVQKYELEEKIEEAPKRIGTQEEALSRDQKEFIAKNADYEAKKAVVLQLRAELEAAMKSREDGEKAMDNISTHREYEALEKQISEAKEREEEIRKSLQKEEKDLAIIDETLKALEGRIEASKQFLQESKTSIDNELAQYNAQIAELKAKEDEITPNLDQEILFKFQRIIQRNDEGIVSVKNGVCTGCHMILPAQFANTVRDSESILFCPYCSRILFYEEADADSTESFFKLEDAGSLADLDDDWGEDDDDEEKEGDLFDKASEFARNTMSADEDDEIPEDDSDSDSDD
ncbi:MAG: C4-type zinc ribbon domain-containing protein [Treponema sp.]|nr:C4-type zinc ribbon domain-containing protein [Treponema sp.]